MRPPAAAAARFAWLLLATAAAVITGVTGVGRDLQSVTTSAQDRQTSIPLDPRRGKGSAPLSLDDPRLKHSDGPGEQVHLTYVNASAVIVSWATGCTDIVNGPLAARNTSVSPYGPLSTVGVTGDSAGAFPVLYGLVDTELDQLAYGYISTYAQIYTGFRNKTGARRTNPNLNYTSPDIHHVQLTDLQPSAMYFYQVTGPYGTRSQTFNFSTPPALGAFPLRLGVFADVGQTQNSSDTLDRMLSLSPEIVTLIGDWAYADEFLTNGTAVMGGFPNNTAKKTVKSPSGSYQGRWDTWFRLAQPLLSRIPIIPNAGNHELEPQGDGWYFRSAPWGLDDGRQFNSYLTRLPVSSIAEQSGGGPLYYSVEAGPVHMIVLNNYEDFLRNGSQYRWLRSDLANINRTRTPWVVAQWHAPWYSSYSSHYKQAESMRAAMEPLLYAAGVDIVLTGHVHAYERTHAVKEYRKDGCGIVHITVGDGGNVEGLDPEFADQPPDKNCPKPGPKSLGSYQPGPLTPSFVYDTNNKHKGYCPTSQPVWSAFRQPAFGHGLLTFLNTTTAYWQWNRNYDDAAVYPDTVYIVRDRGCDGNSRKIAADGPLEFEGHEPPPPPPASPSLTTTTSPSPAPNET